MMPCFNKGKQMKKISLTALMIAYGTSPMFLRADNKYHELFGDTVAIAAGTVGIIGALYGVCKLSNWYGNRRASSYIDSMERKYSYIIKDFYNDSSSYTMLENLIDKIQYYPAADIYLKCPLAKCHDDIQFDIKELTSWIGYAANKAVDCRINNLVHQLEMINNVLEDDPTYRKQAHKVVIRNIEKNIPFLKKYKEPFIAFFNAWHKQEAVNILVVHAQQHDAQGVYKNYPLAKFLEELDFAIEQLEHQIKKSKHTAECKKYLIDLKEIRFAVKSDARFIEESRAVEKRREKERKHKLKEERENARFDKLEQSIARMEFVNAVDKVVSHRPVCPLRRCDHPYSCCNPRHY